MIGTLTCLFTSGITAAGNFESIATTTVGAGGSSSITFSSIPSTYTHLQIRCIVRTDVAGGDATSLQLQLGNSSIDNSSNYSQHNILGYTGSSSGVQVAGSGNTTGFTTGLCSSAGHNTSVFYANVIDIADYSNANKYKTVRGLAGGDDNSGSHYNYIGLTSGNWRSLNAINQIKLYPLSGNFSQYSSFALYGIK